MGGNWANKRVGGLRAFTAGLRVGSFLLLALLLAVPLSAQDTSQQEKKKKGIEQEIKILESQIQKNEAQSKDALEKVKLTGKLISTRKDLIARTNGEIGSLNNQLSARRLTARQMRQRVDTLNKYYSRLLVSAYMSRKMSSWYVYILSSESIGQAYRRYNYFKSLSDNLKAQAVELKQAHLELQAEMDSISVLKSRQQVLRNQQQNDLARLKKEESSYNAQIKNLNKNKKKYTAELVRKRKEVEKLDKEIERIIKSAMAPSSGKKSPSQPVDYVLDGEFSKNKGKLPWPVSGSVVEKYGQHYHPVYKNIKLPFNKGVGIATNENETVRSVFDGVVSQVVVIPGYNLCVMVRHGNYFTLYCKLKSSQVKSGDKVKTGQALGTVDTMSGSTLLHFELWKEQQHQNPENWLR